EKQRDGEDELHEGRNGDYRAGPVGEPHLHVFSSATRSGCLAASPLSVAESMADARSMRPSSTPARRRAPASHFGARRSGIGLPMTAAIAAPGNGTRWRSQRGKRNDGPAAQPIGMIGTPATAANHRAPGLTRRRGPAGPSTAMITSEP